MYLNRPRSVTSKSRNNATNLTVHLVEGRVAPQDGQTDGRGSFSPR